MKLLDRLERRFGRLAIPNVTVGLILGQVALFILDYTDARPGVLANAMLMPHLVLKGEVWRLVTFLFVPPANHPIFAFFFWYLFYLMGTTLENQWGNFRYNVYLAIGILATVSVAFVFPSLTSSNGFLQGSVFLAFAYLYPDFVLQLFLILPVKIKWLALIAWISYLLGFLFGDGLTRLLIAASVSNFFVFFSGDIVRRLRAVHRRKSWESQQEALKSKPRHQCLVCGITNLSDPKMEFRYCTKCVGQCGYCSDHIRDHEHVTEKPEANQRV